mgnify:CR=1 FL=1
MWEAQLPAGLRQTLASTVPLGAGRLQGEIVELQYTPTDHAANGRLVVAQGGTARLAGFILLISAGIAIGAGSLTLARLIGGGVLERGGKDLVDSIVEFQDGVEEATAAAAVLPRWLALPLILWPAARRRRRLEKRIAAALEGDGVPGPWATAFGERGLPASIAAEFSVGLLFAAHKNPAIASFQALRSQTPASFAPRGGCGSGTRRI